MTYTVSSIPCTALWEDRASPFCGGSCIPILGRIVHPRPGEDRASPSCGGSCIPILREDRASPSWGGPACLEGCLASAVERPWPAFRAAVCRVAWPLPGSLPGLRRPARAAPPRPGFPMATRSRTPPSTHGERTARTRKKRWSFKPLRVSGYLSSQHKLAHVNREQSFPGQTRWNPSRVQPDEGR